MCHDHSNVAYLLAVRAVILWVVSLLGSEGGRLAERSLEIKTCRRLFRLSDDESVPGRKSLGL